MDILVQVGWVGTKSSLISMYLVFIDHDKINMERKGIFEHFIVFAIELKFIYLNSCCREVAKNSLQFIHVCPPETMKGSTLIFLLKHGDITFTLHKKSSVPH